MARGRRDAGAIRSLVNARDLQLECARILHETLLLLFLMYGNEITLWKKKERAMIRPVQMENLKGIIGSRRMDRAPNARNKDLCEVTKEIDEKIDERVLRLFGHVQRIVKDRIAKRVYVGEYDGSHSVGRPRKEGIVTVG